MSKGKENSPGVYVKAATPSGYDVVIEQMHSLVFDVGAVGGDCGDGRIRYASWGQGRQYYAPIKEWSHAVFTYSSAGPNDRNANIYINGQWFPGTFWGIDELAGCNPRGGIKYNSSPLRISTDYGNSCPSSDGGSFPGKIDNVRIYGEALSQAAIEQIYVNDIINKKILAKNYNDLLKYY